MNRIRYGRWLIVLFLAVACLSPTAALASNKGIEVPCQVDSNTILVSVLPATVAYGVVELDTTQDTVTLAQPLTATNDGTEAGKFRIKSSNATGGVGWTLGAARGVNIFTHEASIDDFTTPIAMLVVDTYVDLVASVGPGASQDFDLRIGMPTSSDYVEKSITVTILATAP